MVDVVRQKILDDKKWWQILVTIFYRNVPNVIEKSSFFEHTNKIPKSNEFHFVFLEI